MFTPPPPILFSAAHPLLLRALDPKGFQLETQAGLVIFRVAVPYHDITFRLMPCEGDQVVLTIDAMWMEIPSTGPLI